MRVFWKLTGGRPMRLISWQNHLKKGLFICKLGRTYLANGPWSWRREGVNMTVDSFWE
jgi:hypothetical protein